MKLFQTVISSLILLSVLSPISSLHIQINNIHHGYKTTVEGLSHIVQGSTQIILTNLTWEMDQLQPELIPFFRKQGSDKVVMDISQQLIQGVFEQNEVVILLVFKQNTSIITTITLRPHPKHSNENLTSVKSFIQNNCQLSEEF